MALDLIDAYITKLEAILTDLTMMAENECKRIRTGHAPGPSMRDGVGQWEATIKEAKRVMNKGA